MSRHRKPSAGLRSPARFWGSTDEFEPVEPVVPADDPSAMVSSLADLSPSQLRIALGLRPDELLAGDDDA